jgi:hypothetical protein
MATEEGYKTLVRHPCCAVVSAGLGRDCHWDCAVLCCNFAVPLVPCCVVMVAATRQQ